MKITLIQPAMGHHDEDFVGSWKMEPLSMVALASLTPEKHELTFFDDRVERIDYDKPTDLVALTTETYTALRCYQIAEQYKKRGIPIVIGGYHATLVPEETQAYADAIVVGEAENVWEQLLADAERGQLKKIYRGEKRPSMDQQKNDRRILADKKYMPITLVESGRGCKFGCDFCSISSFFNSSYAYRPPQDVAAEIARTGNKIVFLVDDNVAADFDRAKALFRELSPLKIKWFSQGTLNMARDPEMLKLMKQSGCSGVLIGFESLSQENLKAMNKSFNMVKGGIQESIKKIREQGIKIYATFVFGYDYDTPELFEETLEFAEKQKFFLTAFNHMQPFPGTPLYHRMEQEKRLLYPKWWLEPGVKFGDIIFRPKNMSPEELRERLMDCRRKYYRFGSIVSRGLDFKANCKDPSSTFYHFYTNYLMRKELNEKFGFPLGDQTADFPEIKRLDNEAILAATLA